MTDPGGRSSQKTTENVESGGPAARHPVAAFWEGFLSPWTGWQFLRQHPSLWRYAVLPLVLNLLITGLIVVLLIAGFGYFISALHPHFANDWLGRVLEALTFVAVLVLAVGLSLAVWVVLQGIFCSYFYTKLAEQVERRIGTAREEIHDVPVSDQILDALRDAGFLVGANLGLLLLNLVPGAGAILSMVSSYYLTCMTLGQDYFEYPLSLRGKRRADMQAFARRYRAHTLGLGTGVALISFLPLVNAVLLTTVVVGAVLLHHRIAKLEGGLPEGR